MRAAILTVLLGLGIACDPAVSSTSAGAPQAASAGPSQAASKADTPPPATKIEETKTNVTGDRRALSECLLACDEDKKLSHTDRATCRMNCDSGSKVTPSPAADGGLDQAVSCMTRCHEASADAKACVEGCTTSALTAVNAPTKATLDKLGTCLGECQADKTLKATDRETCRLTCSEVASMEGPAPKP